MISNFVTQYAAGRTPLPCAHWNSDLKFSTLLDRAHGFGAQHVATGHYAQVEQAGGRWLLKRSVDRERPLAVPVPNSTGRLAGWPC